MNQSMQQLKKIGTIKPKNSKQIKFSRIGLGLEKLDREVFDPEKVYDKVADTGVKWARIQSGWQRTERQKGVYDFDWIDSIVDNLLQRGVEPWVCLCYGNGLYSDDAKKIFGAVGCPPIFNDEQKNAWANYVKAFTEHFKDRIKFYEVWNEPDGDSCWKHGSNAKEYGEFVIATAKAVRVVYPDANIIGGSVFLYKLD
ncbi:MAG: beta-galactosidase, partial [Clostridia bacterium]|nr:beta-galactosidase [Clostridia bacterium]